uniref:hypothetical protein n=1 Tax=Paenibacillus pasadenensis TaxID=217090 RepID=UPI001C3FA838
PVTRSGAVLGLTAARSGPVPGFTVTQSGAVLGLTATRSGPVPGLITARSGSVQSHCRSMLGNPVPFF